MKKDVKISIAGLHENGTTDSLEVISFGEMYEENGETIVKYEEAMDEVESADVLISKGQGNYEGLSGCGLNMYYFFLCKCEMFMRRFEVEQFTGIMTRE